MRIVSLRLHASQNLQDDSGGVAVERVRDRVAWGSGWACGLAEARPRLRLRESRHVLY